MDTRTREPDTPPRPQEPARSRLSIYEGWVGETPEDRGSKQHSALVLSPSGQFPSVSLAYEKAESDIMHLRPRNPKRDRLVNEPLAAYSYFQIGECPPAPHLPFVLGVCLFCSCHFQCLRLPPGAIQSFAGFTDYFTAMAQEGWFPLLCVGLRPQWEDHHLQDLQDSYGQEWVSTFVPSMWPPLIPPCVTKFSPSIPDALAAKAEERGLSHP